ncbi:MAG: hypothetical protein IJH37_07035 [Clostridia bacterium]|nr:hypothetical protein [Clostridia bacterium]
MLRKIFTLITIAGIITAPVTAVKGEDNITYTFTGTNYITDGSTDDITDKPLTKDITVTTSGAMNRKYAAITNVADNRNAGTFPINDTFTADGSYIYLGCANVNNDVVLTLNLPEIKAGRRVTLTYAKPEVTNNGSTRRNSNDPYAYFKIADRYISINGGSFDEWRTAAVVTGEDTDAIEFHCDMWGAVAISKIEISDGGGVSLHSLGIQSAQYANLTVNGIKFYADANGECKMTSLLEGETISVTAAKDGYVTAEETVIIGGADTALDMPLECETDAVYYESDFGNKNGTLVLDGEFAFGGVEAKDVTKICGYVTFKEGGRLVVNTDKGAAVEMTYKDGIYIGDELITKKDNMEFMLVFDKENNTALFSQNNEEIKLEGVDTSYKSVSSVSGSGAMIEYIGISYAERNKPVITGSDKVASYPYSGAAAVFDIGFDDLYGNIEDIKLSASGMYGLKFIRSGASAFFRAPDGVTGAVRLCAEYNEKKTYKDIEIYPATAAEECKTAKLFSINGVTIAGCYDMHGKLTGTITKAAQHSNTFTDIGDVKEGKTLDGIFEDGYYDITFKKAETGRGDIYINGAMVGNNVDQADADRKVTDGALYKAEDVKITGGKITVSMTDGSTKLDYVTVEKKPDDYERPPRVYIIGDSLACIYYGDFENAVGGGRSGWGQQIGDFLNLPVTDLANSGQYAAGLYRDAFPGVMANAEPGDFLLIECGYNDRSYSTRDEMRTTVKKMIDECRAAGIIPILVTPNASQHDYKPSVVWSSYLKDVAIDKECPLIDLSKESYDFLYSLYGDNTDGVITKNYNLTEVGGDTLHSSYAAAYKWASIVAQGIKDLGYGDIVNTDHKYTFTDTLGNEITAEVK